MTSLPDQNASADDWAEGPGILDAARRYWWLLVLGAVLGGAVGFAYTATVPVLYTTSAHLLLTDLSQQQIFAENRSIPGDPGRYVRNQAQRITSTAVAQTAAEILGDGTTADEVLGSISADPAIEFDIVTITAVAETPQRAAALANAVGEAYERQTSAELRQTAAQAVKELRTAAAGLQEQLDAVDDELEDRPGDATLEAQRSQLQTQFLQLEGRANQLEVDAALHGSRVQQFERAEPPSRPSQPRTGRTVAASVLLALVTSAAVAWWLSGRRRSADGRQDPAALLGVPLLGAIPDFRALKVEGQTPTLSAPRSPAAEAYQFVLSSMTTSLAELKGTTVLITSAQPGDGKTVTALNLALAASHDERQVLIVDADARVRGLSRLTELDDRPGLRELQSDPDTLVWTGLRQHFAHPNLEVVTAGAVIEDPAAFFRTSAFRRAVKRMRDHADLVLIDSPPLLAVSDTSTIAEHVDAIVLVVAQGTSLDALNEVRGRLTFLGTPVLGYVFNRADARSAPYSYYSYDPPSAADESGGDGEWHAPNVKPRPPTSMPQAPAVSPPPTVNGFKGPARQESPTGSRQ